MNKSAITEYFQRVAIDWEQWGNNNRFYHGCISRFIGGMILRLIFGPHRLAEPGTHYVEPNHPYYHSPAATDELAKDDPELAPDHHYLKELALLTKTYSLQPSASES